MSKIIFCAILLFAADVSCKEIEEDSSGKYEYMQIFRNIPRLFEYFLSRLAEKPEVLEKDDITVFIKNADLNVKKEKVKRDTCSIEDNDGKSKIETTCPISKKSGKAKRDNEKSNIQTTYDIIQNKHHNQNKAVQEKRNTDTKYQHCLSDADAINCKNGNVKRDVVNKPYEFNANIETPRKKYNISYGNTRNTVNLNEARNGLDKSNTALKKHGYVKGINNRKSEKKNKRHSAADSRLFTFSAEEVEDKILMVEQMLEDHNEKNSKKIK